MYKVKTSLLSWNLPGIHEEKQEGPQDSQFPRRYSKRESTEYKLDSSCSGKFDL